MGARALLLVLLAGARLLRAFDMSQCIAPLGMESGLIPDKDISASSCYNDGNVAPHNGRLNQDRQGGAWCPSSQITTEASEWLEVDLHAVHVITAVGTQGRFGNGQGQEYAEAYALDYWRPKLGKWLRYHEPDGQEVLSGNTNTYLEKKNRLQPVWASKVRLVPRSAHRRTVCMRLELYGCLWTAGIVSYSIPKGDKRSNGMELSDAMYDGVRSGGELRGGLGQLVDGVYGTDDIREAARASAWLGWRNESRARPPHMLFEFERVREFTAVHIYCNNKFMRDVQIFSEAVISFSVGGRRFQEEAVRYTHDADGIFESSRNVTVPLHHRIGRWVRIELSFAARWILVSEVVFESAPAQGEHAAERGGGGGAGDAPTTERAARGDVRQATRAADPLYAAVAVGVLTALAILLAVGVAVLVHRHRHRKCFTSSAHAHEPRALKPRVALDTYSACGTAMLCEKAAAASEPTDGKCAEYQEPYQAAPYCAYSTVLLEMNNYTQHEQHAPPSDGSNYEYAVPELSSAPLLGSAPVTSLLGSAPVTSLRPRHSPRHLPASHDDCRHADTWLSGDSDDSDDGEEVYEFPRHRLRMISKLAEGAFGTVFVAEAEGAGVEGGLVAVKFLSAAAGGGERAQFVRDVRVLARLRHAGLARVLGACSQPPLAVVLEYLPAGALPDALRRAAAPPAPRQLAALAEQLAAALRYLESLNFVHRDVAARNCLVDEALRLKLGDLGTDAERFSRDYYRGAGVVAAGGGGVPLRWSAWEAALHARHSTSSDVWALAVTLTEIYTLCRRSPYQHLTDLEVVENLQHLAADDGLFVPLSVEACPHELRPLLLQCWARDAARRPSAAAAHRALQRMLPLT